MSTKKILTSHKGRRCRYPKCKRALSIYNHDILCHVHLNKQALEARLKGCEK
jgi:hypothetical protein